MIRPPYNVMMLPQNNDRGEPAVDEAGDLCASMTLRRRQSQTSIYRPRTAHNPGNIADHDLGLCCPLYRGFRLHCLAGEIEAAKRAVDDWWTARYHAAETPAARVAVLMEERGMRATPKDWNG